MKKNIKRKLLTCFVILQILVISGLPSFAEASVLGYFLGGSTAGGFVGAALKEMGIDSSLTREITESGNVFNSKTWAPQVEITFIGDVRPGGKVKAIANVSGIDNLDSAYYTWYIKRGDSDDVEEWKKLAIIENKKNNSSFNPLEFDQTYNGGNGDGEVSENEWRKHEKDNDGYIASNGGDNNKGRGDQFYYIYDLESGKFYELGKADGKLEGVLCDDGYIPLCMVDDQSGRHPCQPLEIIEGEGSATGGSSNSSSSSGDSESSGEGGSAEFTIEGENVSGVDFNRCIDNGTPRCTSSGTKCPNGGKAYCVPKPDTKTGKIFRALNDACPDDREAIREMWKAGEVVGAGCEDYATGGYLEEFECESEPSEEEDYKPFNGPSFHLFPVESYNEEGEPQPYGMPDGNFDLEAEMKFELNPENNNTVKKIGNVSIKNDEAFVVGLGVKELTWTYQEGDEVGVVVEGTTSTITKHPDGTFQSVFAFMSNGCKPRKKGAYDIEVGQERVTIETSKMDVPALNDCLKNNLVKPGSNESKDLTISMTGPEDVVTNSESNTFEVYAQTITSDADPITPTTLNYNWAISCSQGETQETYEDRVDITKEMSEKLSYGKLKGNNNPHVVFSSFFPEKCFDSGGRGYAYVEAKINGNYKQGRTSFGMSEISFPIQKSGGNITFYSTRVTEDGKIEKIDKICDDERNYALCRFYPGEIIEAEAPIPEGGSASLFSWFLNGQSYTLCNSDLGNICYFPVPNSIGSGMNISFKYSDQGEGTYANKSSSRQTIITKPDAKIKSDNYIVKGYYNYDGESYEDASSKNIVFSGDSLSLEANIPGGNVGNSFKLEWDINGEKINNQASVSFVPKSSTAELKMLYSIPAENKKLLKDKFGIDVYSFANVYSTTTVNLISEESVIAQNKKNTFFATAANNTPAYFFFLLKSFLMISTMLFVSHLIFSFVNHNSRRY